MTEVYQLMLEAEKKAGTKDAIAASAEVLGSVLKEKGLSYEELITVVQAL